VTRRARARTWIARNPTAVRYVLLGCAMASLVIGAVLIYYYVSFSRIIDARLHGERERSLPRVYARPLEVRRGETLTEAELIARLNDLGYAQRPTVQAPGEFAIARNAVLLTPRAGAFSGKTIRATFPAPAPLSANEQSLIAWLRAAPTAIAAVRTATMDSERKSPPDKDPFAVSEDSEPKFTELAFLYPQDHAREDSKKYDRGGPR